MSENLREAAQQALDYMKSVGQLDMYLKEYEIVGRLEAALAEPEPVQEPVACIDALKDAFFEGFTSVATYNDTLLNSPEEAWGNYKPPRITLRQAEPVQEPGKFWPLAPLTGYYDVGGKRVWLEKDDPFPEPLPPQREPLTDEEISDLASR